MSREAIADLLNISARTYAKIETGERLPDLRELQIISDTFEIDPSIFLQKGGNTIINHGDNSPGVGYGNTISSDPETSKALIAAIQRLDEILDHLLKPGKTKQDR